MMRRACRSQESRQQAIFSWTSMTWHPQDRRRPWPRPDSLQYYRRAVGAAIYPVRAEIAEMILSVELDSRDAGKDQTLQSQGTEIPINEVFWRASDSQAVDNLGRLRIRPLFSASGWWCNSRHLSRKRAKLSDISKLEKLRKLSTHRAKNGRTPSVVWWRMVCK